MDKYDRAIDYLTNNPDQIENSWFGGNNKDLHRSKGSCLFAYATKTGFSGNRRDGKRCDCLTGIRADCGVAQTKRLTERIINDERIPESFGDITINNLPIFAMWQRRLDKELKRV